MSERRKRPARGQEPEDLPRYVPVAPSGNGHKVRPDLQTKIIGALILGLILYMGKSILDKVDSFGERIARIETLLGEVVRRLDALETK